MSLVLQLSRLVVRSKLTRRASMRQVMMHQILAVDAGDIYVGLGDQFDDDRRLVRDVAHGCGMRSP